LFFQFGNLEDDERNHNNQNAYIYKTRKLVLVSYRYNNRYPGCTTRTSVPSQPICLNIVVRKKNKKKKKKNKKKKKKKKKNKPRTVPTQTKKKKNRKKKGLKKNIIKKKKKKKT